LPSSGGWECKGPRHRFLTGGKEKEEVGDAVSVGVFMLICRGDGSAKNFRRAGPGEGEMSLSGSSPRPAMSINRGERSRYPGARDLLLLVSGLLGGRRLPIRREKRGEVLTSLGGGKRKEGM